MTHSRDKTVFVLGAGFSVTAGVPSQAYLLEKILELSDCEKISKFIEDVFGLKGEQASKLDLEDIYTPIHQSISNDEYLKSYSPAELKEIERNLNTSISQLIDQSNGDQEYIAKFAEYLVNDKRNSIASDNIAVLSLNWDIILDNMLFETSDRTIINYGCHTAGINGANKMIPILTAKERNSCKKDIQGYDPFLIVKLFKLHGSLNWATCPKCKRVFVSKGYKEGLNALEGFSDCPQCNKVKLNATLLLPSFQKELQKHHFQQIWTQAAKELSEASKIVFIGYSFPLADFDFRSLMTKHLSKDVEVEVVLYKRDGCDDCDSSTRYKKYFGERLKDENIYRDGAAHYIENLINKAAE